MNLRYLITEQVGPDRIAVIGACEHLYQAQQAGRRAVAARYRDGDLQWAPTTDDCWRLMYSRRYTGVRISRLHPLPAKPDRRRPSLRDTWKLAL